MTEFDRSARRAMIRPAPPRPGLIREKIADAIGVAVIFGIAALFLWVTA